MSCDPRLRGQRSRIPHTQKLQFRVNALKKCEKFFGVRIEPAQIVKGEGGQRNIAIKMVRPNQTSKIDGTF